MIVHHRVSFALRRDRFSSAMPCTAVKICSRDVPEIGCVVSRYS
jgi:hypothetical protein